MDLLIFKKKLIISPLVFATSMSQFFDAPKMGYIDVTVYFHLLKATAMSQLACTLM